MDDDDKVIPFPRRVIAEAGGTVDETHVTLALYSDTLDPDEVTRVLGTAPTSAHRRGEQRFARSRPYKTGAWLLSVEGKAPTDADELIPALLAPLPDAPEFWAALREQYTVRVILGLFQNNWNRGFRLSPKTVALLARTGVPVDFDLYSDGPDE